MAEEEAGEVSSTRYRSGRQNIKLPAQMAEEDTGVDGRIDSEKWTDWRNT
ncbi:hypothetical protein ACTQ1O_09195 [Bilifractor sp. LCP21S3_A7]|jgi:hypothetical protein